MNTCVIFCAGGFEKLARPIDASDYILAADGGLAHVQKLGLKPHGIIGDFDSLGYIPQDAQVFPVEKDDTDSMLAVKKGLELGYRRFEIYGSLDGDRLDHTIANLQTLAYLRRYGAVGYLIGIRYMVTVLENGALRFPKEAAGILSVFCMGAKAQRVCLRNLKYNVENATITGDFPLGVSNHFTGKPARITVEKGSILAMWDRKNGFPTR